MTENPTTNQAEGDAQKLPAATFRFAASDSAAVRAAAEEIARRFGREVSASFGEGGPEGFITDTAGQVATLTFAASSDEARIAAEEIARFYGRRVEVGFGGEIEGFTAEAPALKPRAARPASASASRPRASEIWAGDDEDLSAMAAALAGKAD